MKRVLKALAASSLALGLAATASLVQEAGAGASTPATNAPTITGYTAGSLGAVPEPNGDAFGPDTGLNTIQITGTCFSSADTSDNCNTKDFPTAVTIGSTSVPAIAFDDQGTTPGFSVFATGGSAGQKMEITLPEGTSTEWETPGSVGYPDYTSSSPFYGFDALPVENVSISIKDATKKLGYQYWPNTAANSDLQGAGYDFPTYTAPTTLINPKADGPGGSTVSNAANLSLTKVSKLKVDGSGFNPGMSVLVTICNSDASLTSPLVELHEGDTNSQACQGLNLLADVFTVSSTGTVAAGASINAGYLDYIASDFNANAQCPEITAQAQEGVNCIVGVAEVAVGTSTGLPAADGNTTSNGIWFAAPPLQVSDSYLGGTGAGAEYSVSISDAGTATPSGLPPYQSTDEPTPTTGGFATDGVICETGTGPGTGNACNPELTGDAPSTCQAASSGTLGTTDTAWELSSTPGCTYGAAVGEPIELEFVKVPTGSTVPVGEPLNCDPSTETCSVSANAGYGSSDPGGFTAALDYFTGTGYSTFPLTPGKYTVAAVGASSGELAEGTLDLLTGPSS